MYRSYELLVPPEPAVRWEAYRAIVVREWKALRDRRGVPERDYQAFFERHPCMLPWIGGLSDIGHHGLFPGAVISQPKLPRYGGGIPDFLLVTRNSMNAYANFVEIETPDKPWFTRAGRPTHQLTQAIDQIRQWSAWFAKPVNTLLFQHEYRIPDNGFLVFKPRFALVYGSRSDPSLTEEMNSKRPFMQLPDEEFLTFDRLYPNPQAGQALTVKLRRGKYVAVSVPPTVELNPIDASDWSLIAKKEDAVQKNAYLSPTCKAFLAQRWSYWDTWARNNGSFSASLGDHE